MSIFSRLWHRFAESVSIRAYRRIYFSMRQDALQQLALISNRPGVSSDSLVPTGELIVSLTTHGKRLSDVWLAIESTMQGTVLPNRFILWLDETGKERPLPVLIQHQMKRGLEVRYTKDLGPYTKLIPALREFPDATIVTIDDDIIYPVDMLEGLLNAYLRHPNSICANRVVEMTRDSKGSFTTLRTWPVTQQYEQPASDNFFEAVAGVLYPPQSLAPETTDVSLCQSLSPTADDIWFNAMARKQNTPIIAVCNHNEPPYLWVNESMQSDALHLKNNNPLRPLNDIQLQKVWEHCFS